MKAVHDFLEQSSKDYGKGVALKKKKNAGGDDAADAAEEAGLKTEADGDRRARERDVAHRGGDADQDEEESSDGGECEYEEVEVEEIVVDPVMCQLYLGFDNGKDDYMLICKHEWCGQAAHLSCTGEKEYDKPCGELGHVTFKLDWGKWMCPACQYGVFIGSSEDPDVPAE